MSLPLSAGGSLEFVRSAYQLGGEFYFSFRHFHALSNELVSPKLVICPTDARLPVASFASLNNQNLSYFVGTSKRHIPVRTRSWPAIAISPMISSGPRRLGPNNSLRWTH